MVTQPSDDKLLFRPPIKNPQKSDSGNYDNKIIIHYLLLFLNSMGAQHAFEEINKVR
jgi:hypothetical protein